MSRLGVGAQEFSSPTHKLEFEQVGTEGGVPLVRQVAEIAAITAPTQPLPTGAATNAAVVALAAAVAADQPRTVSGTVDVGNFPATQAVSAAALPLPVGAATEETLGELLYSTNSVLALITGVPIGNETVAKESTQLEVLDAAEAAAAATVQLAAAGLALDDTVEAVRDRLPSALGPGGGLKVDELVGTFGYGAATLASGSPNYQPAGRVASFRVFAQGADGSLTINGGDPIAVRSGTGFDWSPRTLLTSPVFAWVSGTLDVFVELAS